jgi:hypothetical protein
MALSKAKARAYIERLPELFRDAVHGVKLAYLFFFAFSPEALADICAFSRKRTLAALLKIRALVPGADRNGLYAKALSLCTVTREELERQMAGLTECENDGRLVILDCDYTLWCARPFFVIAARCPHCGEDVAFHTGSDFVPYKEAEALFPCPWCLAPIQWSGEAARDRLWDIYENTKRGVIWKRGQKRGREHRYSVLLARALTPVALIRFGACTPAIGHMVLEVNRLYNGKRFRFYAPSLDYFTYDHCRDINRHAAYQWDKVFLAARFDNDMRLVMTSQALACAKLLPYTSPNHIQHDGFEAQYPETTVLPWRFTEEEHDVARKRMQAMGIPEGAKVACLLVRDGAYQRRLPGAYHLPYRNADIDSYRLAANFLADQGWYVLRMGHIVEKPLSWQSDRIIDYASFFHDPFMDIYLFMHCALCIATGTGNDILSVLSHVPYVYTNFFYEFEPYAMYGPSVYIRKHIYLKNENRQLSLQEYYANTYALTEKTGRELRARQSRLGRLCGPWIKPWQTLDDQGIEVIDNTPEELYDAVSLCLEMINNDDRSTGEDLAREELARNLLENPMRHCKRSPLARFGRLYLRNTPIRMEN